MPEDPKSEERPKRGETRKRRTRDQILRTATKLFYEEGVGAVGVDRVAAEAGVSKRTLYNHFPSKDALLLAYLTGQDRPREPGEDPVAAILAVFERMEGRIAHAGFRGCPFVMAAAELADPAHPASRLAQDFKRRSRSWLAERLAAAGVAAPEPLAEEIAILMDGTLAQATVLGDPAVARAARRAALTLIEAARR